MSLAEQYRRRYDCLKDEVNIRDDEIERLKRTINTMEKHQVVAVESNKSTPVVSIRSTRQNPGVIVSEDAPVKKSPKKSIKKANGKKEVSVITSEEETANDKKTESNGASSLCAEEYEQLQLGKLLSKYIQHGEGGAKQSIGRMIGGIAQSSNQQRFLMNSNQAVEDSQYIDQQIRMAAQQIVYQQQQAQQEAMMFSMPRQQQLVFNEGEVIFCATPAAPSTSSMISIGQNGRFPVMQSPMFNAIQASPSPFSQVPIMLNGAQMSNAANRSVNPYQKFYKSSNADI